MTATAPQGTRTQLLDLLEAQRAAWRLIGAHYEAGQPITQDEGTELLAFLAESLDVHLLYIRHYVKTSRPLVPMDQLIATAEVVLARVRQLVQRLGGTASPSDQFTDHVQSSRR